MVSREDLKEHFSNMGATLTDEALAKCEELCLSYGVDEEELAETWTAYSCSNSVDMDPSVDALNRMERAEFGAKKTTPAAARTPTSSLVVYGGGGRDDEAFEDDILSSYSVTPKAKSVHSYKKGTTPDQRSSPKVIFSPASFSPTVSTPSARYASRTNSGSVLGSYGSSSEKATWYSSTSYVPALKTVSSVPPEARYMFDTLRERISLYEENMRFVGKVLMSKAGIQDVQEFSELHTDEFECCGRICTSGHNLSFKNVFLESFPTDSKPCTAFIDVKEVPKLSLFPGQVVAVRAINPTRSELLAHDIISDATMPLSEDPLLFPSKEGPFQVVIASGPYTQADTMTYQPLEDFVNYLKKHRPHVAILIGPFVDAEHTHVKDGLLAETFESFFEKQVENLMQSLSGLHTQVVLVASSREVHHHPIFPTPAYSLKKKHPNLHLMGDPCIMDIDGLKIGVTSVDVLKHIGNQEIVNAANSQDRLCRIAKHILMQNNFYPLYPPNENLNVDTKLWYDYCHMPFTPHILVLPSDLRAFIKESFGCVLVNPEHLAKGFVGGSFARLEVQAVKKWDSSCISGQVVKI